MKRFGLALAFATLLSLAGAQAQGPILPGPGLPVAATASGWCSLIPQSGLVNCWPMDTANTTSGTATDTVGSKNATLTSVTLNGSGPTSHLNNAIVCNGTSSKADTPGPASTTPPPKSAFSVVYWIFPVGVSGSPSVIANDNTAGADNNGIRFFNDTANTRLVQFLGNGTTSATPPGPIATFPTSTWNMSTVTYDGTTITSYVGASSQGTSTLAGPVATPTNALGFCYNPASGTDFFNGKIAGVAIYNRAITSGEVTTINGL